MAIGQYNEVSAEGSADTVFRVGVGNASERRDAMRVMSDGRVLVRSSNGSMGVVVPASADCQPCSMVAALALKVDQAIARAEASEAKAETAKAEADAASKRIAVLEEKMARLLA